MKMKWYCLTETKLFHLSFFLNTPIKMKEFGLTETKLFHFYRVFKDWGGMDPPMDSSDTQTGLCLCCKHAFRFSHNKTQI